jgi:hypothetical protein
MQNGGADGTGFDSSLLEGLPLSQFNWTEWNVSCLVNTCSVDRAWVSLYATFLLTGQTYFEQLDRMFPNNANGGNEQQAFTAMQ